eukprot:359094-Chlamydomonas_euryale.AAC.25
MPITRVAGLRGDIDANTPHRVLVASQPEAPVARWQQRLRDKPRHHFALVDRLRHSTVHAGLAADDLAHRRERSVSLRILGRRRRPWRRVLVAAAW